MIEAALHKIDSLSPVFNVPPEYFPRDGKLRSALALIERFRDQHEEMCWISNENFIANEQKEWRDYLDGIEKNPLTLMQQRAVITHEDNTLVVAGAGSGKTSVILAKTGYLLRKGLATPDSLLLLAFNREAAREMTTRIQSRLGCMVEASTFHALGLRIIAEVEGKKPALNQMAEDVVKLQTFIQNHVEQLISDPVTFESSITYFQSYFAPYKNHFDFASLGDYWGYVRAYEMRTLQGEMCRSYEECEIANFLFLQGIRYEYEAAYEVGTATISHRQYKPDFYLPDYRLYIEHFGVDENGMPPSWMNDRESHAYRRSMDWKRGLHHENGTSLIESYSWQKKQGTLLYHLTKNLRRHKVVFNPISPDEALNAIKENHRFSRFTDVAKTFLGHYKGNGHTKATLTAYAKEKNLWNERLDAFLSIFLPVLEEYERNLSDKNELDFNDMIVRAATYVEKGDYSSPYNCVLIDEFQDISTGRARLIRALAEQSRNNRLFCVGDDWQAIYRFSGSDISLMRDFRDNFGYTADVKLDRTFRFNDKIEAVASKFILANSEQIPKALNTPETNKYPTVILHHPISQNESVIDHAIKMISEDADRRSIEEPEIMFLGRYNFETEGLALSEFKEKHPLLKFSISSIHKAKGLESDYVVVLGLRQAVYGFPSEIADDPLLEVVLASPEGFPHAEERRLFYVAITRARHAAHVIVDRIAPSTFAMELVTGGYPITCFGTLAESVNCPKCKTGVLVQRSSEYGVFYSCNHHPLCDYKTRPCPQCGAGLMLKDTSLHAEVCTNQHCNHTERACPSCKKGRLVERAGPHGPFIGCTEFRNGCRYTEKISLKANTLA